MIFGALYKQVDENNHNGNGNEGNGNTGNGNEGTLRTVYCTQFIELLFYIYFEILSVINTKVKIQGVSKKRPATFRG